MRDRGSEGRNSATIVLGGEAGQGIQTIEFILARVLKRSGYHIFSTKEYMSRIRGGTNTITIRVSDRPVAALAHRVDLLVPLHRSVLEHVGDRMREDTLILGDAGVLDAGPRTVHAPLSEIAREAGGKIYENTAAVGILAGALDADRQVLADYVREYFARKKPEVIEHNEAAALAGHAWGLALRGEGKVPFSIPRNPEVRGNLLISGAEAVGLGAIAGGCNFVSSYPMSPSTAVLTFLAAHDESFGIVAEQAEDEIAAVNMAVGAWYSGARAMATTSGGGFALMEEGISLAGMLETPLVIHLAQRPGPATGLPTRTEQGDLELALYAGHGEFPRVVYAPGSTRECFLLTARAFDVADRCQVPVFILTDQYTMDTYYDIPGLDLEAVPFRKHIVKSPADYLRYRITENGISPRAVPGFGDGLVTADSDEHDEAGHITEDMGVRVAMVDKRLRKAASLDAEALGPVFAGPEDYSILLAGWGSTHHVISEALELSGRTDTACLHFPQVYPFPSRARRYLEQAQKVVVVENNATGQFARLLNLHGGREADELILRYDGLAFTVEELTEAIGALEGED
ncbi:MAG: 2-oxoacid:acceptor oxidoreductase subunit alpha [bacterium]|nr:MAG: 2-oxoacid:acceptor oxidoreductase subunit alpha [bacterium]